MALGGCRHWVHKPLGDDDPKLPIQQGKRFQSMFQRREHLMRQRHPSQKLKRRPRPQPESIAHHTGNQRGVRMGIKTVALACRQFPCPDWRHSHVDQVMFPPPPLDPLYCRVWHPQSMGICPGRQYSNLQIPTSGKSYRRPIIRSFISKASANDRFGSCETKRSPSSFDIRGITAFSAMIFKAWSAGNVFRLVGVLQSSDGAAAVMIPRCGGHPEFFKNLLEKFSLTTLRKRRQPLGGF